MFVVYLGDVASVVIIFVEEELVGGPWMAKRWVRLKVKWDPRAEVETVLRKSSARLLRRETHWQSHGETGEKIAFLVLANQRDSSE